MGTLFSKVAKICDESCVEENYLNRLERATATQRKRENAGKMSLRDSIPPGNGKNPLRKTQKKDTVAARNDAWAMREFRNCVLPQCRK